MMEVLLLPKTKEAEEIIKKHGAACRVLKHNADRPLIVEHCQYPNQHTEINPSQFNWVYTRLTS